MCKHTGLFDMVLKLPLLNIRHIWSKLSDILESADIVIMIFSLSQIVKPQFQPPMGISHGSQKDLLVSVDMGSVFHYNKGEKEKEILNFRFEGKAGHMRDVAVKGNMCAVVFIYELHLYKF